MRDGDAAVQVHSFDVGAAALQLGGDRIPASFARAHQEPIPRHVLERRHGTVIPGFTSGGGNRDGSVSTSYKTYKVGTSGEGMWEIARRTLGDGNRWGEILRLNPDLKSSNQVLNALPPGTVVQLPAEARGQP